MAQYNSRQPLQEFPGKLQLFQYRGAAFSSDFSLPCPKPTEGVNEPQHAYFCIAVL